MTAALQTLTDDGSSPKDSSLSILLIDDDARMCALIAKFFTQYDFLVDVVSDGASGLAIAVLGRHDLILLKVTLPVLDGFQVLRQIRQHSTVPVVFLTSRHSEQICIAGLDAGADDFIAKPFRLLELLARVRAVLGRSGRVKGAGPVIVSDIVLNPRTREVRKSKVLVSVTSFEFDVLYLLMRSAGRVVSRDELANVLYRRQARLSQRTIDVHVSNLRRKLETNNRPLIRTVWGVGYLFVATDEAVK